MGSISPVSTVAATARGQELADDRADRASAAVGPIFSALMSAATSGDANGSSRLNGIINAHVASGALSEGQASTLKSVVSTLSAQPGDTERDGGSQSSAAESDRLTRAAEIIDGLKKRLETTAAYTADADRVASNVAGLVLDRAI